MKPRKPSAELLIHQVVAGDRPWTDLRPLGVEVCLDEGRCLIQPQFPGEVRVYLFHVVRGFRTHMHDPHRLREWAFVIEALPIDIDVPEGYDSGEVVMDALWSASFGDLLRADQISLIEALGREDEDDP